MTKGNDHREEKSLQLLEKRKPALEKGAGKIELGGRRGGG